MLQWNMDKQMEVECIVRLVNHKFLILPCYNGHGTVILYDKKTHYMHIKHIQKMELNLLWQPPTLT